MTDLTYAQAAAESGKSQRTLRYHANLPVHHAYKLKVFRSAGKKKSPMVRISRRALTAWLEKVER